jgi:hypothetical protein
MHAPTDPQRTAAPSVIGLRFSKILIFDLLPAEETQTGVLLHQALAPLPSQLGRPVVVEHRAIASRHDLANALDGALHEVVYEGHTPLLHFECHGNPDGLELRAANEFIPWDELSPRLTELNIATRLNLFVGLSACYGAYLVHEARVEVGVILDSPLWQILGNSNGEVSERNLYSVILAPYFRHCRLPVFPRFEKPEHAGGLPCSGRRGYFPSDPLSAADFSNSQIECSLQI